MEVPKTVDIAFTDDGDIDFLETNHALHYSAINEIRDVNVITQIIKHRIKSVKPDWFHDGVGANLEAILGEDNSRATAQKGADLIMTALTGDGFVNESDVYVRPIPADLFTIIYYLAVRISDEDVLQFKINIALNAGVNVEEMI